MLENHIFTQISATFCWRQKHRYYGDGQCCKRLPSRFNQNVEEL